MSEIAALQTNSLGVTTFEKVEWAEVKAPASASPKSSGCCQSTDGVSFSAPVRKNLEAKKSYFQQPPSQTEQLRQARQDQRPPFEIIG